MQKKLVIRDHDPLGNCLHGNIGLDKTHPHFYSAQDLDGNWFYVLSKNGDYKIDEEVTLSCEYLSGNYIIDHGRIVHDLRRTIRDAINAAMPRPMYN